jgi:hypothetical protein
MQFDVPGWLASVMGWSRDELVFDGEHEQEGALTVTYSRAGKPAATVNLVALPLPGANSASWQLAAQLNGHREKVQVPAKTRFVWR